jgi:hypothetical protein
MKQVYAVSVIGAALLGMMSSAPAGAMSVNGNLSDWGVTVSDYTGSTYHCGSDPSRCRGTDWGTLPANGTTLAGGAKLLGSSFDNNSVEDGNDVSNNYGNAPQLSPYFGGQNFDAEFMGVAQDNGKLYVAIASGQRPDNGYSYFEPGDLKMVVNSAGGPANGTYGVELGGGSGHGGYGNTAAITTTGGKGSTYRLYSSGKVRSVYSLSGQTIGSIWKNAQFLDGINGTEATQIDQNHHGSSAGTLSAIYETQDSSGNQHSIIELEFDLAALLGSSDPSVWAAYTMDFTWGPSCGNDLVLSGVQLAAGDIPTPEPAALTILLFGIGAAARMRRRRAA